MTDILLGVGNSLASDDRAGLMVADLVSAASSDSWQVIHAGTVPENFTGPIRKAAPDILIIVDAAEMGLVPGRVRRIQPDNIKDAGWGTHQSSLSFLTTYLSPVCSNIIIIGIQIQSREPGERVSKPVRKAVQWLSEVIIKREWNDIPLFCHS